MSGRNDPCPCGSGKKYKKCCLLKEQAAQAKRAAEETEGRAQQSENAFGDEDDINQEPVLNLKPSTTRLSTTNPQLPTPETDPLLERINAFWEAFLDAPYAQQWSSVTDMLANEPEILDGEMVFEIANTLFGQAIDAGDIERYQHLLQQLAELAPEAYAAELHYILDWQVRIALIEGDDAALARYFYQYSPVAHELDIYYRIISAMQYHGKLDILYEGMRQARPFVADAPGLVPWAYEEFTEKLGDIELLYRLEQNSNLTVTDAILRQHFVEYDLTIKDDIFSLELDYRTGRRTPAWTSADFFRMKGKKGKQGRQNLAYLLYAFTYHVSTETALPPTRIEMAREQLLRYFGQRLEGELDAPGSSYDRSQSRRRQQKIRQVLEKSPLCPDPKTLDAYMARLMGFLSSQYYETAVLFEIVPIWMRFLVGCGLIEDIARQQTIESLHYMKSHLLQIMDNHQSDPVLRENLQDWPYTDELG